MRFRNAPYMGTAEAFIPQTGRQQSGVPISRVRRPDRGNHALELRNYGHFWSFSAAEM